MSEIKKTLADLTPEQRAKLAGRLASREIRAAESIPARPPDAPPVLSPGQERLWRMTTAGATSATYAMSSVWHLSGALDVDALAAAVDSLVERHTQLRTTFDGRGVPHEWPSARGLLDTSEAESVTATLAEIQSLAAALHPEHSVFRARLWRIAENEHVLALIAHHLVCDGVSLEVIESDLSESYTAVVNGAPIHVPAAAVSYADYAHWKRSRPVAEETLEVWRKRLVGAETLRLPVREVADAPPAAPRRFELGGGLTASVEATAKELRVSPFAVLASVFAIMFNRHTGQEDVLICTPEAGRGHRDLERVVGYFNDVAVLRLDLSGDPTIAEVFWRLQSGVAAALEHRDIPFQHVASLAKHVRMTNALFGLTERGGRPLELAGLDVARLSPDLEGSDFRIGWFMDRGGSEGYQGTITFDRVAEDDIQHLIEAYRLVLGKALTDLAATLSSLPAFEGPPVSATTAPTGRDRAPMSRLEAEMQRIWSTVFERHVGLDDSFFDLGGHSLLAAELMDMVERELVGHRVPLASLFSAPTAAGLAEAIQGDGVDASWSCVVPIEPGGAKRPFFFVHAHGGNVIGYRDLARHTDPDRPFYAIQAPDMHEDRAAPLRIDEMASRYVEEVQTVQPDGPYLLGGFCLGGAIALEMGRMLQADGAEVATVIMVDNPRPEALAAGSSKPAGSGTRLRQRIRLEWSNLIEKRRGRRLRHVRRRLADTASRLALVVERRATRPDGRLPLGLRHSDRYREEVLAARHNKAYETFMPAPYDGRVAIVRAEMEAHSRGEPTLGWDRLLTGQIDLYVAPGHRTGLLARPRVADLAAIVDQALAVAEGHDK